MAIGWKNVELDVDFEKEEVCNGASDTIPVDNRSGESDQDSKSNQVVTMTCQYCVKKNKQRRMRDLNSALKEGLSASASASYRPGSLPVVQFQNPGSRVVSMQEIPSAPAQHPTQTPPAPLGLWEQCR